MKVYILTLEPFPNGMAATSRIKCYAKAIIQGGIECVVVNYYRTEQYGKKPKNTMGHGIFEGIPYMYIGNTPQRGCNVLIRRFNDWLDKRKLVYFLKKNIKPGDVVIHHANRDPRFVKKIINIITTCGGKNVRELCELPFGTGVETNKSKKLREKTLNTLFPMFDGFISISNTLSDLASQYKNKDAKIIKIPILVDFEKYNIEDKSREVNIPYIFHSGTLSEQKDGFLGMIEAFGLARKKISKDLRFISTGTIDKSPHSKDIEHLIDKYELEDSFSFCGYLSNAELRNCLSKASLVIINKYNSIQNKYCFSTKLAEYLAASKPVIITNVGEAMNWLKNRESAIIIEPKNVEELSNAIVELITNENLAKSIATNGKNVCKSSFSYIEYSKMLTCYLRNL